MVVGEVSTSTDVLVIGGGPGGYAAALRAAALGRSVTLVERDAVGGTCLNVGCIPSKALIHAAELAHLAETSAPTGVTLTATVDLPAVLAHLRSVVTGLTTGVRGLLDAAGVEVVTGTARFARANRVVVSDDAGVAHIEFDQAIVATGSRPIELPDLPFGHGPVTDSTGALLGFDRVPETLVIVGGGYIGIELGTAWAKLGAAVTIVEAAPTILPGLDTRLARVAERRLAELGVDVRTNTVAVGLGEGSSVRLALADRSEEVAIPAERVVVCVGRRPNTDDLGLQVVGVTVDADGLIPVDAGRRAAARILAIGDVTAGPALAHKAMAEAEVAARTAAGLPARFDVAAIPAVVFADPELATVGLTRSQAAAAGIEASSFVFPLGASARARTMHPGPGSPPGHVELVADADGTVIGAHLAGPNVSELVGEAALAIEMAATLDEVAATIHPHPTLSEGLLEAANGALGLPLHVARARSASTA